MAERPRECLPSQIAELFAAAEKLPLGRERDELLWKALELEATLKVERWINSSGLQPPRKVGCDN
ncbi:hypothetical protein AYJ54_28825 [Bradyrhizobium centrolobii]|uniref:Transposase n=1 Tax=Bradyrhizobium centrolobii TaxID=1505087 RepID=A0A176YD69_9BRAD|nr:hypothetical protein AYJ54_28825 [Bradyrhizobium centrolobii]